MYWLLWRKLSWKWSLLVICKSLRPFVNTLTAQGKYSLLNREYLPHAIHMQLSQKQKKFSKFFSKFFKSRLNFEHIQKKTWYSGLMYFPNSILLKTWLYKCQKSIDSEYPWTSNMVNGPKHRWNVNSGTLIIFIDHCEGNWVWKSHS